MVVRIQEARNLPLRKKSKKNPSTYIVLRCGTEKGKTNVDKDSRDPTWGQIFRFGGARQKSGHLSLSGEVVKDVKLKSLEKLSKDMNTAFYVDQRVKAKYKRHKTMCVATIIDIDESKGRCTLRYDAVKDIRVMVYVMFEREAREFQSYLSLHLRCQTYSNNNSLYLFARTDTTAQV